MGMPFLSDTKVQLEGRYPEAIFQMPFNLHSAPGCAREKAVLLDKKMSPFITFVMVNMVLVLKLATLFNLFYYSSVAFSLTLSIFQAHKKPVLKCIEVKNELVSDLSGILMP